MNISYCYGSGIVSIFYSENMNLSLYRFVRGTELVNAQFLKMVHDMVCYYFETIPGGSDGKEPAYTARDLGQIPGSERSPWRRAWQIIPVFLPGESHGQGSLVSNSPWGCKESGTTE